MTVPVLQGDKAHKNREMEHYSSANIKKMVFLNLMNHCKILEALLPNTHCYSFLSCWLLVELLVLLVPYFSM